MKLLHLLLAVAIISFVSCNNISEKLGSESTDTETTEEAEDPEVYADEDFSDDETEATDELTETETTEESAETTAKTTEEIIKERVEPGSFYIIAGSFKDYQKAENLYKELVSKGYSDTQILDPVNKFSRVVIRSFDDEKKARAEMEKLRKQYNDESIWLLSTK